MTKCKLSFGFPALYSVDILVISYLFDAISLVEIMSYMDEWTEFCNLIIIMSKMHTCMWSAINKNRTTGALCFPFFGCL